ncbi:hypothetical protein FACS189426_24140 [Bacteroidia bacterium]|nr:hypothetical protein FACS189426_24140 [Bacteroidia bacterium]
MTFFVIGCSESFLDTENLTKKDSQSFPQKSSDAAQVLTAAYKVLVVNNNPRHSILLVSEAMSDDRLGAGGLDDRFIRAIANYKKDEENMYLEPWRKYYNGVNRANFLLSSIDQVAWDNDEQKNRTAGEAHFLRAYFYFDLARMFGTVPLILDPVPQNNPKASPEELFGQIALDLKTAIELIPAVKYQNIDKNTLGHATKWAAEALLARAFLFYTGYYNKAGITMADGTELTKAQVVGYVDDCVANSGHGLVSDFRNLWLYTASPDYSYTKDNSLSWVDENDNQETIFSIKHASTNGQGRNLDVLFFGLRYQEPSDYTNCFPFGQGWGCVTVNRTTFEQWPDNDLRKKASILDVDDPSEQIAYFDDGDHQMEDTHLFQKKYIPINVNKDDGSGIQGYWAKRYNMGPDYASENYQDKVVIRYADLLLMGAELGSANAQVYLDQVRNRVNSPIRFPDFP